jgi:hypothetical protein
VGFGVFEPVRIVGVAFQAGVFVFEDMVEVGDGGDGGVVDGGVPEVDGGVVTGFGGFGWCGGHSGSPLIVGEEGRRTTQLGEGAPFLV